MRSFARTWSVDLKERHIRVNVVSPGIIPTAADDRLGITDEMHTAMLNGIPLGRLGTPDEVTKAVVFLASDDSSYITDIELFVDGGVAQI
ncbi:MAG: SDR family oxidoreductase [Nostoc sp.]|uniref:SDR family oxidoreductase n=1 Tax=unclassified Nostoc TaxID=2593658 RepID=UPI0025D40FA8|nr:SDR family oxidoreductase [Nostoc sp. NMS9]